LKYIDGKIKSATLGISKNGIIFGRFVCEIDTPQKIEVKSVLGIDRGIIYPIVSSNNKFFDSKHLRNIKGKYQWLKSQLQSKGTKSAKRHLQRLSGREKRFVRDTNHILSKRIVEMEFDCFAFEKLQISRKKSNGRKFNKKLGSWSPRQLLSFVEYKAENLGKSVVFVKADYTSQTCSVCGFKSRQNRNGLSFKCLKCGFSLHSDLNASRNIAELGKAQFSRFVVNEPIVASLRESYKPLNLLSGN
jgi:IS605 OrfB family transposase